MRVLLWIDSQLRRSATDIRTGYRPAEHYMRGPGPKWHEKNKSQSSGGDFPGCAGLASAPTKASPGFPVA